MKKLEIFTDGSCLGNPGSGGIGVILRYGVHEKELSVGYFHTTNNRMEMLAVIHALNSLKQHCEVDLYSDSQYVKNGMQSWLFNWKKNDWAVATKKKIKNLDLWRQLDELNQQHKINWCWVKGHAGHEENERCDILAKNGANNPTLEDRGFLE